MAAKRTSPALEHSISIQKRGYSMSLSTRRRVIDMVLIGSEIHVKRIVPRNSRPHA